MYICEVLRYFHLSATNTHHVPGDKIKVSGEQLAKIEALGRNMVKVLEVEEAIEEPVEDVIEEVIEEPVMEETLPEEPVMEETLPEEPVAEKPKKTKKTKQ